MTPVKFRWSNRVWVLTTAHAASTNSVPVLIDDQGKVYGPDDWVVKSPTYRVQASAIANFALWDNPPGTPNAAAVNAFCRCLPHRDYGFTY